MSASIFNGTAIKLLKNILRFKNGVELITNDSDDPTSVAKNAPRGSMYVRSGTQDVYVKKDNGSSVNWVRLGTLDDLTAYVQGPASATDNAIARFDATTGKLIQNSSCSISDGGELTLGADASGSMGAVTKQQLDAAIQGVDVKEGVKAASILSEGNITLSGEQTIDGVALVTGNRVLIKNNTTQSENGIYIVDSGAWTRASDANTGPELEGAFVSVAQGSQANTGWYQVTDSVNLGVSNIVFNQFFGAGTYSADGQGIELSGSTFSLELDGGTLAKSASGLKVATQGIADNEISNTAAIALSKLAALTIDRALISDGTGIVAVSSVSATELGYLSGVTSALQGQIDAKADITYVDAEIDKTPVKTAVPLATAAALPSYTHLSNVLTATANGALTVDGQSPGFPDLILVKNESGADAKYNGIYICTDGGSAGTPWILTRADNANSSDELHGAMVTVTEGSQAGFYRQTTAMPNLGVSDINWVVSGGSDRALRNLSNLDATTAINSALVPDTDITYDLGDVALRWNTVFANSMESSSGLVFYSGSTLEFQSGGNSLFNFSGGGGNSHIQPGATFKNLILQSANPGSVSTGFAALYTASASGYPTGMIDLYTGDADGSSASGDVSIGSGTTVNGNSGSFNLFSGVPSGSGTRGSITLSARYINLNADVEISAGNKKIVSMADPSADQDAATKIYVDGKVKKYTISTITTNTNAAVDNAYLVGTNTAAVTVTLPAAVANARILIKDKDGNAMNNNITITGTVDGISNPVLNNAYESAELLCDGTNWWRI